MCTKTIKFVLWVDRIGRHKREKIGQYIFVIKKINLAKQISSPIQSHLYFLVASSPLSPPHIPTHTYLQLQQNSVAVPPCMSAMRRRRDPTPAGNLFVVVVVVVVVDVLFLFFLFFFHRLSFCPVDLILPDLLLFASLGCTTPRSISKVAKRTHKKTIPSCVITLWIDR